MTENIIIILLFILVAIQVSSGQECINACELSQYECVNVNYPIYPVALNVSQNEANASAIISQVEPFSRFYPECIEKVKLYTCAYFYPSCSNNSILGEPPIKRKPCLQMCLEVNTICDGAKQFLTTEQLQFINCSQTTSDGDSFFEDGGDCYSLDSLSPVPRCGNNSDILPDRGAGCQAYNTSLASLTSPFCSPFISPEVYVEYKYPPNAQEAMDQQAHATLEFITKIYPVISAACYKHLLSLLCQTFFPSCNRVESETGVVELGSVPCNQFCDAVDNECRYYSELFRYPFINCTMTLPSGELFWPIGPNISVTVNNNTIENTCSNTLFAPGAKADFVMPIIDKCPSIFGKNPDPGEYEQQCWVPCPDPSYTDKMWHDLIIIGEVGSSVSFVLMFFLFITTIFCTKHRSKRIYLSVYFAVMCQNISFFINGPNPETSVWCDDPVTYATRTNAACAAQGFIFQWATLAVAAWWTIISYHMFSSIVLRAPIEGMRKREKYYHIFGWGLPLILAIITISVDGIGYGPPVPWCFVHDPGMVNDYSSEPYHAVAGISLDYWVFYIPIGISILVAVTMLVPVFIYIYKTFRAMREVRGKSQEELKVQIRVICFVVLLLIVFGLLFEYRFAMETTDLEKIKNGDFLFVLCQVKNELGIEYSDTCLGDELPYRISYSHVAFETFLAASFGTFVFLVLGTEPIIYKWWYHLITRREFLSESETRTSISMHEKRQASSV